MANNRISTRERLRYLDNSLTSRLQRVRKRFIFIVQAAFGAGLAFWVAQTFFGHAVPFFAPISVVVILGISGGNRLNKAVEMSVAGVVGVGVGQLLVHTLGTGDWQIAAGVAISLTVAAFLSKSLLVSNQVAIGAILIATIMPQGGGTERIIDAAIGSVIGIISIALIPNSALRDARHEIAKVLSVASSVLHDVAEGAEAGDSERIEDALQQVRGTQSNIDHMLEATASGREIAGVSPFRWGSRKHLRSIERILTPVDNATRNVRVLARRCMVLSVDGDKMTPRLINIIDELAEIALELSQIYETSARVSQAHEIPGIVNRLRIIGARTDLSVISDDPVLSEYAILSQVRFLTVDLLMVSGMSRESAAAVLAPTSSTPAYPPEVWEIDDIQDNACNEADRYGESEGSEKE